MFIYGIVKSYSSWTYHGEPFESHSDEDYDDNESSFEATKYGLRDDEEQNGTKPMEQDAMEDMLHDMFIRPFYYNDNVEDAYTDYSPLQVPEGEGDKFARLVRDAQEPLYVGCENMSKFSFIVKLLQLKSMNNWSEKSFNMLLELFKEALPEGANIPNSFYEVKKVVCDLGLNYVKIDVRQNGCSLFGDQIGTKLSVQLVASLDGNLKRANKVKIPHKVFALFPI